MGAGRAPAPRAPCGSEGRARGVQRGGGESRARNPRGGASEIHEREDRAEGRAQGPCRAAGASLAPAPGLREEEV